MIKSGTVFFLPLSNNIFRGHAGQFFYGMVPGNHCPGHINGKGRVGKEIYDIGEAFFRRFHRPLCFFSPYRLTDFMDQFSEL